MSYGDGSWDPFDDFLLPECFIQSNSILLFSGTWYILAVLGTLLFDKCCGPFCVFGSSQTLVHASFRLQLTMGSQLQPTVYEVLL